MKYFVRYCYSVKDPAQKNKLKKTAFKKSCFLSAPKYSGQNGQCVSSSSRVRFTREENFDPTIHGHGDDLQSHEVLSLHGLLHHGCDGVSPRVKERHRRQIIPLLRRKPLTRPTNSLAHFIPYQLRFLSLGGNHHRKAVALGRNEFHLHLVPDLGTLEDEARGIAICRIGHPKWLRSRSEVELARFLYALGLRTDLVAGQDLVGRLGLTEVNDAKGNEQSKQENLQTHEKFLSVRWMTVYFLGTIQKAFCQEKTPQTSPFSIKKVPLKGPFFFSKLSTGSRYHLPISHNTIFLNRIIHIRIQLNLIIIGCSTGKSSDAPRFCT
jgi:hypothetical protein